MKDSQLVRREAEAQTSTMRIGDGGEKRADYGRRKSDTALLAGGEDVLKNKLSEVLSEGLLDSVLPYLIPASPVKKVSTTGKFLERSSSTTVTALASKESGLVRKKSIESELTKATLTKNE